MKISPIILTFILLMVFAQPVLAANCQFSSSDPSVCNPAPNLLVDLKTNTFDNLFTFLLTAALGVVGILSVVFIVIGGVQYISARGDEEMAEAGKKTLKNAIIGLTIVILSYVAVVAVINALWGKP